MSHLPRMPLAREPKRVPALALGALVALALLMAAFCACADARVEVVGTTKVGLQAPEMASYWEGGLKWNGLGTEPEANAAVERFRNDPADPNAPGPVMHSVDTYAIYWDPQDYYHGDWQGLIDGFLANAGAAGSELGDVFALDRQYTDATNVPAAGQSSFHGAYTDTNPYPQSQGCADPHRWAFSREWEFAGIPLLESSAPVCLTDKQIREQLQTFIGEQHELQPGMGTIFYVLTPPGVAVCLDGGGPSGHCSEFEGTVEEISEYEEETSNYPERLERYKEEEATYKQALEVYEKEKAEKEAKHEPDTAEAPTAPVKPTLPTVPASYASYAKSFCSYHSYINPPGSPEGSSGTIVYAVIPWSAGGDGDYHLSTGERTGGYDCQDGGFAPATQPGGELQEKERVKPRTPKEQEEFEEKSKKEKREQEEAEALGLGKPHEQEPNQLGSIPGPDGSYDTGLADLIINQIAVEQQNTVTDPLLNGWQDPRGSELTDECRNSFFAAGGSAGANPLTHAGMLSNQRFTEGHAYYLNDTFNFASELLPYPSIPCLHGVTLEPKFTAPNTVNAGEIVGFDGMESDITLNAAIDYNRTNPERTYAIYTWNFGDGSPEVSGFAPGAPAFNSPATAPCAEPWVAPCAASTYHAYKYGGTYAVTLTVKDVGGDVASITLPVTVDGPPPPSSSSENPGGGGSSSPGASTLSSRASTPGASSKPVLAAPLAAQAVLSSSLGKATHGGLVVSYSVNEQVTGSFNVLLAASIARRIGLHFPLAKGLPAGTPPQEIVGRALLITTKGGRGKVKIEFGKVTGARLRKLHKVSLMLQLDLRNASGGTATVLSKITLH